MATELGNWIFDFEITDYFTHPKNYTVYKIKSVVFPVNIPESLTSLTVWKRYNEIKKLHIAMSKIYKKLHLGEGDFPHLKDDNYFQRMNTNTIEHRIEFILNLLNFIAEYPPLYKSYEFLNFFEITRISNQTIKQNLQNIKSISTSVDKDDMEESKVKNDEPVKNNSDNCTEINESFTKKESPAKAQSSDTSSQSTSTIKTITTNDYIYDAALKFSEAVRAEVNLNYIEAFQLYKYGIDILMGGARFDVQEERKRMAKDKLQKYIKKAQQIYDCHIMNGMNDTEIILQTTNLSNRVSIERPINQLAKFKVIKILNNVMQVQDVTNKKVYIMKAIDKPSPNNKPNLINLPKNVPFMVPLIAYFNTETKIYLLLQQASGGRLYDYIASFDQCELKPIINKVYSNQCSKSASPLNANSNHKNPSIDSLKTNSKSLNNCDSLSKHQDIDDIVKSSKELLKSVSKALLDFTTLTDTAQHLTINNHYVQNISKIPKRTIKRWASEIVTAISNLHSMDIICMDLNMNNILLGSNGEILLTYFYRQECTQQFYQKPLSLDAIDALYVACERPLTTKSDWYSFGIILFEFLTGYSFVSCHPAGISPHFEIQYPEVELDDDSKDLLQGLLKTDPDSRYGKSEIQNHNFFHNINWNDLCDNASDRETEYIYFASS